MLSCSHSHSACDESQTMETSLVLQGAPRAAGPQSTPSGGTASTTALTPPPQLPTHPPTFTPHLHTHPPSYPLTPPPPIPLPTYSPTISTPPSPPPPPPHAAPAVNCCQGWGVWPVHARPADTHCGKRAAEHLLHRAVEPGEWGCGAVVVVMVVVMMVWWWWWCWNPNTGVAALVVPAALTG